MFFVKLCIILFFFICFINFTICLSINRDLYMKKNKEYNFPLTKSFSNFYKAKNINQHKYINYLNDQDTKILFAVGPTGTGKTLLACNTAIYQLKTQIINKIIITRPIIREENIENNMDSWSRNIFDIFSEYYSKNELDKMISNNIIEISPLSYLKGRTLKKTFIIGDEMHNSYHNDMLMLMTRIGLGSKMVITGNIENDNDNNGLIDFINKFKLYKSHNNHNIGIKLVQMENSDIERNPIIKTLLDIYNISNITTTNKLIFKKNNTSNNINQDAALIPKEHYIEIKY